jgi:adenylate cyclase class IV
LVERLADNGPTKLAQDDTFFPCRSGRLKLRMFSPSEGELIFYQRADASGPKESFYLRSPTTAPTALRESLCAAYGESGRIRKHREVYLVGRTRVHLDIVEGLGHFLELEVVLGDGEPIEAGVQEAHRLMSAFGIDPSQLVAGAYVDLARHLTA